MAKTYAEIASEAELPRPTRRRFISYMLERWSKEEGLNSATGYAREWADRFKKSNEYGASDLSGQAILNRMDKTHEGVYCPCCGKQATELDYSSGECISCGGLLKSE